MVCSWKAYSHREQGFGEKQQSRHLSGTQIEYYITLLLQVVFSAFVNAPSTPNTRTATVVWHVLIARWRTNTI